MWGRAPWWRLKSQIACQQPTAQPSVQGQMHRAHCERMCVYVGVRGRRGYVGKAKTEDRAPDSRLGWWMVERQQTETETETF